MDCVDEPWHDELAGRVDDARAGNLAPRHEGPALMRPSTTMTAVGRQRAAIAVSVPPVTAMTEDCLEQWRTTARSDQRGGRQTTGE
jgi:hypothetical protein